MQTETQTQNLVKLDNLLDIDSLKRAEIEIILDHAVSMEEVLNRDIKKVPSLRGKTIVTLFYESSTRTRVSFEQAGKILSADVININNKTQNHPIIHIDDITDLFMLIFLVMCLQELKNLKLLTLRIKLRMLK